MTTDFPHFFHLELDKKLCQTATEINSRIINQSHQQAKNRVIEEYNLSSFKDELTHAISKNLDLSCLGQQESPDTIALQCFAFSVAKRLQYTPSHLGLLEAVEHSILKVQGEYQ